MSIEDDIRRVVREEVRAAVREALADVGKALTPPVDDGYLSVEKAAELAEVHPDTIRAWIKAGRLVRHQAGRELRVRRSELHAFLACEKASERATPEAEAAGILARRRKS